MGMILGEGDRGGGLKTSLRRENQWPRPFLVGAFGVEKMAEGFVGLQLPNVISP